MRSRDDGQRRDRDDESVRRRAADRRERERQGLGHAFSRHRDVSQRQLDRRVLEGVNERGHRDERRVKDATRFSRSDGDLLRTADAIWRSADVTDRRQHREAQYKAGLIKQPRVTGEVRLKDVLGPGWRNRVDGRSFAPPDRTRPTRFTDEARGFACWEMRPDGEWFLVTCYPKPGP